MVYRETAYYSDCSQNKTASLSELACLFSCEVYDQRDASWLLQYLLILDDVVYSFIRQNWFYEAIVKLNPFLRTDFTFTNPYLVHAG